MTGPEPPDQITLRGLEVYGRHGVLPEERSGGQPFRIDAVLRLDTRAAAAADELAATVDYGVLAEQLAAVVEGNPVSLLETLAQRLAEVCLADARVEQVEITVHKPAAPIPVRFDDVAVTITRRRP